MTNGPEKSDLSTVAKKPANNPGRSAAESVERREGAEGNSGQQRTHRTQSRASVSSGLLRVRNEQDVTRRRGSPLCCIMLRSICSGLHSFH